MPHQPSRSSSSDGHTSSSTTGGGLGSGGIGAAPGAMPERGDVPRAVCCPLGCRARSGSPWPCRNWAELGAGAEALAGFGAVLSTTGEPAGSLCFSCMMAGRQQCV